MNIFRPLNEYERPLQCGYRLLPFRFTELEGSKTPPWRGLLVLWGLPTPAWVEGAARYRRTIPHVHP